MLCRQAPASRGGRPRRTPRPSRPWSTAHNPATANLPPMEFLGNIMLLIVGVLSLFYIRLLREPK